MLSLLNTFQLAKNTQYSLARETLHPYYPIFTQWPQGRAEAVLLSFRSNCIEATRYGLYYFYTGIRLTSDVQLMRS